MRLPLMVIGGLVLVSGGLYTALGWSRSASLDDAQRFVGEAFALEVRVTGTVSVHPDEVLSRVPLQRSAVWWAINSAVVRDAVILHPAIADARVVRCPDAGMHLGCFQIEVRERAPAFVAEVGDQMWIVGQDGGFVRPLRELRTIDELRSRVGNDLRLVRGLLSRASSPDMTKARVRFALATIRAIEESSARSVTAIDFRPGDEIRLRFGDLPFSVIMAGSEISQFADQGRRLRALVNSFQGDLASVQQVDLAFHKLGVVRLHDRTAIQGSAKR